MRMITPNKKAKKGFSLIEMLAVIAIIAILVAILIPVVKSSTTKAAAATNAANLRNVEGVLSNLRVSDPSTLKNSAGQDIKTIVASVRATIEGMINESPNHRVMIALGNALISLEEDIALNAFYAEDEKLQLNGMTIDAPNAKPITIPLEDGQEFKIRGTTKMEVVITENDIIVTYAGMTAEAFAAIAEDGDATDIANTNHKYIDSNGDHICDICNGSYNHSPEDIADGIIDNVVSGGHVCKDDSPADHICDDPACDLQIDYCEEYLATSGPTEHVCTKCGKVESHSFVKADDSTHTCVCCESGPHNLEGHDCSYCDYIAPCTFTSDGPSGHHCTVCPATGTHGSWAKYGETEHICGANGCEYTEECATSGGWGEQADCSKCNRKKTGGCVTLGTLIAMADGTQKPVEDLKIGDMLLAFNHITGKLEAAPLIFNTHSGDAYDYYDVLHLQFSNGTEVEIVQSHGFFDTTMMKYVYITYDNYTDFIGHKFYSDNGEVTLTEAFIEEEYTAIYCPVTYFHMNSFANGMLNTPNIPGDITGLVNYFEYDADLKYNEEAMQQDIEQYGLYTYADFSDYISEAAYNSSPAVHLKVAVGKGMITFEQVLAVIEYLLAGSLID